ncbi:unnamed protein product [Mytilus edulis]|uniref:G-protein coupled receptors family 1 profile domain-containing protein n=1 Tax=Mytilus edulis TaxID=6550 RepID=A0A8S3TAI7_MYTED|nr:unnamed protein product [Mytilus edulis]
MEEIRVNLNRQFEILRYLRMQSSSHLTFISSTAWISTSDDNITSTLTRLDNASKVSTTAKSITVLSREVHDFYLRMINDKVYEKTLLPSLIYLSILLIIGLPGNLLVSYIYHTKERNIAGNTKSREKKSSDIFIITLAWLDILNCILSVPMEIYLLRYFVVFDHPWICKLSRYVAMVLNAASSFVLLGIAVDRFIGIKYSQSKYRFTATTATNNCNFTSFDALDKNKNVQLNGFKHIEQYGTTSDDPCMKQSNITTKKSNMPNDSAVHGKVYKAGKTTFMLFVVTIVFMLTFAPYCAIAILRNVSPDDFYSKLSNMEKAFYQLFLRSYLLSSAANPVIYSFLSDRRLRVDEPELVAMRPVDIRVNEPQLAALGEVNEVYDEPLLLPGFNEVDIFISQKLKDKIWNFEYIDLSLMHHIKECSHLRTCHLFRQLHGFPHQTITLLQLQPNLSRILGKKVVGNRNLSSMRLPTGKRKTQLKSKNVIDISPITFNNCNFTSFDALDKNKNVQLNGFKHIEQYVTTSDDLPFTKQSNITTKKSNTPKDSAVHGKVYKVGKSTFMLFVVAIVFMLTFAPYCAIAILRNVSPDDFYSKLSNTEKAFYQLFLRSYLLSSAANPVIYSFLSDRFRQQCLFLLKRIFRRQ